MAKPRIYLATSSLLSAMSLCPALFCAQKAQAADAITLTLGGRINEYFFAADQDHAPGEDLNTVGMLNDVRVSAEGKTVLDNGISIRSYVRVFAVGRENVDVDEAYVDIGTTLGRLRVGEKAGINASVIGDPIPEALLTVDDVLVGDALRARNGIVMRDAFTFKRFTGNALGVSYQSPELAGVKVGVAYHPNPTPGVIGTFDRATGPHDAVEFTAGYDGDWSGGTYRLAGGYFHQGSRSGVTSASVFNDGLHAWNMSAGGTYGGWEVGAAYMQVDQDNGVREYDWTVGALYGIGPFKISADYRQARQRTFTPGQGTLSAGVISARDQVNQMLLQGAYKLGPGISVGVGGFYAQQRDVAGTWWDSSGVLSGIKIGF